MKLSKVNTKICEIKLMIQKMNENVFELILASSELECRYKEAVKAKDITYAMSIDLIETEKRVDNLMEPYKSILGTGD